jgi:hypothetical protein
MVDDRDRATGRQACAQDLERMLRGNAWFMGVLHAVRDCAPPDWLVGGGVIRSMVWDRLHGHAQPTPLADVDVAFFDPDDLRPERDRDVQAQLLARRPDVPWEATNQAAVHLWYERAFGYAVPPLHSSEEAIGTWPETATCVAVRLLDDDALWIVAPLGLDDLFQMVLRRNPRRASLEQFRKRAREKRTLEKWPQVRWVDG